MTRYDEFPFGPDLSLNELLDASNECCHGRLPFDDSPECGCWNIRRKPRAVVKRLPVKRPGRKKRAA